ncbi:butyrate--CoA ligase AAE11, peroxisomal-like [Chenopodium quinoa]|uniref:butyrate--CoA ligase AAE11, peroxisomal-like n=1 Tax=Chenopodium quinoa TaxID=63459 RepID=UPI000B76DF8B|nr:butyrate--CoA ligase AAE11, peroxisomal-like [Chenopodium quinoa]
MNTYMNKYEANYTALTPITFLKRAAKFYADRTSIVYGGARFTWRQTYDRCRRLASSLQSLGIAKNDVVSVLAPNIPAMYEMHFAVPMAGAVLNTINTRLDANTLKSILDHSEAKILFVDYEYIPLAYEALCLLNNDPKRSTSKTSIVIITEMDSPTNKHGKHERQNFVTMENVNGRHNKMHDNNQLEYEYLIDMGNVDFVPMNIDDEWDPIALNYTSGTTSSPKGVVYSHRGAFLSSLSMILGWEMGTEPVYLWSLPMFHCNGWTFAWGIAARGGTNVCIRNTTASIIYQSIALHGVTHMCCAPIVLDIIREAKLNELVQLTSQVQVLTGGSPPQPGLLKEMVKLGFHIVHGYGLTKSVGPALVCEWQKKWYCLSQEEQAQLKARQGISPLSIADVDVKDTVTMQSVPNDGKTTGEIVICGSCIMKGYFKNENATAKAFANGWFHTGDVGVIHPDGYIELKDRLKDVIISGGENISSVQVERVIYRHQNVSEVAVVGMPHPRWGESPFAFVVRSGKDESVTEQDIITYCRKNLPHYMVPKKVCFVKELPKTSTGKVQKGILRAMAKKLFDVQNNLVLSQNIVGSRL